MHLLVYLLALVNVGALIGELRLHLRVAQLQKRPRPEESIRSLETEVRKSLIVLFPHVSVDVEESLDQVARSAVINLVDDALQKIIRYIQIAFTERLRKELVPEPGCDFCARWVTGI